MSTVGYTSEQAPAGFPNLRPVVSKTFLKGIIGLAAFSVLMQLSLANLVNYLIFLALSLGVLGGYMWYKRSSSYEVGDDFLVVKRPMRFLEPIFGRRARQPEMTLSYDDIVDIAVSQGFLARRFGCGSVYLILKHGGGSLRLMGGGTAERLQDVKNPNFVYKYMLDRLGPFSQS